MKALGRTFRPLDTSRAEAALDAYEQSVKGVAVRARALRMDVNCGDLCETAEKVARLLQRGARLAGHTLRQLYQGTVDQPLPNDMVQQLDKLD